MREPAAAPERGPAPLAPVVRDHLEALSGPHGIFQHARGAEPDPAFGTCTDDVARALGVDLLHAGHVGWTAVAASAERSVRYLVEALEAGGGRFRNFRAADGTWLDEPGSDDCQGRAVLALAQGSVTIPEPALRSVAGIALERAWATAAGLEALRAISSAVLACTTVVEADLRGEGGADERVAGGLGVAGGLDPVAAGSASDRGAAALLERLAGRLGSRFDDVGGARAWPWPEDVVTYESALPARALIAAGRTLGRPDLVGRGLATLDWLLAAQIDADGRFHPIGNRGWWRRFAAQARFDQQPIEATSTILAAETAQRVTDDERYVAAAESAYAWFLGRNDLDVPIAEPSRGACHDGLEAGGLNANQGAESTLMWLTAVERIRRLRRRVAGRAQPAGSVPALAGG